MMQDTEEIWKDIPGFEAKYQASNLGRIKSLARIDRMGRPVPERILKEQHNGNGYLFVCVYTQVNNRKKARLIYIHRLVFMSFYGYIPKYIDHINSIRHDNRLLNLDDVTARENSHRARLKSNRDLPLGVHLLKSGQRRKKYQAKIMHNGKQIMLGNYLTPEEASTVYQEKLATFNSI